MTITDQITALLSADPIYGGRVTGETVPTFHNLCGRRTIYRQCGCRACTKPFADAIERGDFGVGEG